ncbi:MAG: hypothetical protein HQ518_21575 [Rhodopirellula sp.]|nr:hypothetical protein [Rhodopirellula sp.]
MPDLSDEFEYRLSLVRNLAYDEAQARLAGFYDWLRSEPETLVIVERLENETGAAEILEAGSHRSPPNASTPEQIAGVGLLLVRQIKDGAAAYDLSERYGITPSFNSAKLQDYFAAVFDRFVAPAFEYIRREVAITSVAATPALSSFASTYPLEITESLARFGRDHPDPRRTAFIMMQFGATSMHNAIVSSIRSTLAKYGVTALRADDKEYHDDLFPNVLTYMHGTAFGIAVFERLEADDFNPNVSLEVGYMRALHKPVCLLKDKTLRALQTDLVGKLYKSFDPQDPTGSIPEELTKWLFDKDIVT